MMVWGGLIAGGIVLEVVLVKALRDITRRLDDDAMKAANREKVIQMMRSGETVIHSTMEKGWSRKLKVPRRGWNR